MSPLRLTRSRGRNGRRADRMTVALAALAVGTAGSVIAGELVRLGRRRAPWREAAERPTASEAIGTAGRATQDVVAVVREGYEAAPRHETVLFNLLSGFVGSFAAVRLSTAGMRGGWWPLGNVRV